MNKQTKLIILGVVVVLLILTIAFTILLYNEKQYGGGRFVYPSPEYGNYALTAFLGMSLVIVMLSGSCVAIIISICYFIRSKVKKQFK